VGESVRVGIDVGGTNTDAVAIDDAGAVVARVKEPTTADPTDGIVAALRVVAADRAVDRVALGTTHAVNAIVQRRGLRRVAVLRLGAPGTLAVPPCTGWPADLVAAILGPVLVARGGVEVDGRAHPLVPD
jgi:N-methylhydantoinase A/oxoprolinase/acetone carboxylase beta subunit